MMRVHVLGSAAGGGFPQWNCNYHQSKGMREGTLNAKPRTQSSIAVSADNEHWVLFNASPDIRAQLLAFPDIQPARKLRDTGISAIILIDGQIDHTTGLLILREGCPLTVYCTDMVYQDLTTGFPIFNILQHWNGGLQRQPIPLEPDSHFTIPEIDGLQFTAIPLSSKAPPYSPHRHDPHPGDNIGVQIQDINTGKTVFYAPGLGAIEPQIEPFMRDADCLLVDGTFWTEDELVVVGLDKKAREIGHLPQSGAGGMIEVLHALQKPRKILIHINNTNPILLEDSPERVQLEAEGIEVAYDGMDIVL